MPGDGSEAWEQSFYGFLSEYGEWDVEKFWIFHRALIEIARAKVDGTPVDQELAYALLYIQQNVLIHVASHFNKTVDWSFKTISDDKLYELKERFELAILGAVTGDVFNESSFETVNPLLSDA